MLLWIGVENKWDCPSTLGRRARYLNPCWSRWVAIGVNTFGWGLNGWGEGFIFGDGIWAIGEQAGVPEWELLPNDTEKII